MVFETAEYHLLSGPHQYITCESLQRPATVIYQGILLLI